MTKAFKAGRAYGLTEAPGKRGLQWRIGYEQRMLHLQEQDMDCPVDAVQFTRGRISGLRTAQIRAESR